MKLSLGVIVIGVVLVTLRGPLAEIATMPAGSLADPGYWQRLAEATLRSFGNAGDLAINFVAGALGIDLWQRRKESSADAADPPGA